MFTTDMISVQWLESIFSYRDAVSITGQHLKENKPEHSGPAHRLFQRKLPRTQLGMLGAIIIIIGVLIFWFAFSQGNRADWHTLESSQMENDHPPLIDPSFTLLDELILVHITGAVRYPGVYELATESRVIDVAQQAGGFADDAQPDLVNLARIVRDAEHIYIPRIGEQSSAFQGNNADSALININTADKNALDTLPRIGPSLAERIMSYRENYGPFTTLESLLAVSGIGPAVVEDLRDKITF